MSTKTLPKKAVTKRAMKRPAAPTPAVAEARPRDGQEIEREMRATLSPEAYRQWSIEQYDKLAELEDTSAEFAIHAQAEVALREPAWDDLYRKWKEKKDAAAR